LALDFGHVDDVAMINAREHKTMNGVVALRCPVVNPFECALQVALPGKFLLFEGIVLKVEIGILKEPNQLCLHCFLQCGHNRRLKLQIRLEFLGNLPHQALEWQLPYQQLSARMIFLECARYCNPQIQTNPA